jgi:molybdate transport system substrate-binding protein
MTKIQPDLERRCRTSVVYVFGSSGQLATQIAAGAGFGLLLSADSQYPAQLTAAGLTVPNGVAAYGVGRVVLATRAGIDPLADVRALAHTEVRRLSIANPDHAPYGRAAEQVLRSAGVYEQVRSKFVLGENVRQAADYVEQGNADAGIVAYALVINGSPAKWTLIDAALHQPIEQTGAVVARTGAELTARCVLQYLLDPAGQSALREFGFEAPGR